MASLIITEGPAAVQKFALEGHALVMLGRDASCTIQLIDSQMSRFHLQIKHVPEERRHHAIDFQSKNGVLVNDRKIEAPTPLTDQDIIKVGESVIVYVTDDTVDAHHVCEVMKRFGQGHVHTMTQ